MKRVNFYLGIIALIGLISSCSQHEEMADAGQERKTVTFNVGTDIQIGTRAATEYTMPEGYKLRYIMAVYSQGSTVVIKRVEASATDMTASVTLNTELDKGTYDIVFFADFIPKDATPGENGLFTDKWWDTADLLRMGAKPTIKTQSDLLARDAFSGVLPGVVKANTEISESVTLKRPWGRLNLVATDANPSSITKVEMEYTPMYGYYNARTQKIEEAGGTIKRTFGLSSPRQNATILSDFLLTSKDGITTNKEITVKVYTDNTDTPYNTITIPAGIPFKTNYITNIKGNFLEKENKNITYTLTADPAFDGTNDRNTAGEEINP